MNVNIQHDAKERRFFAQFEDGDAELVYTEPAPKTMDIQHTYVPESGRGHGIAEALVVAAFDHAREHDLRVIPTCPFVRRWLSSRPGLESLVDPRYARRAR